MMVDKSISAPAADISIPLDFLKITTKHPLWNSGNFVINFLFSKNMKIVFGAKLFIKEFTVVQQQQELIS